MGNLTTEPLGGDMVWNIRPFKSDTFWGNIHTCSLVQFELDQLFIEIEIKYSRGVDVVAVYGWYVCGVNWKLSAMPAPEISQFWRRFSLYMKKKESKNKIENKQTAFRKVFCIFVGIRFPRVLRYTYIL